MSAAVTCTTSQTPPRSASAVRSAASCAAAAERRHQLAALAAFQARPIGAGQAAHARGRIGAEHPASRAGSSRIRPRRNGEQSMTPATNAATSGRASKSASVRRRACPGGRDVSSAMPRLGPRGVGGLEPRADAFGERLLGGLGRLGLLFGCPLHVPSASFDRQPEGDDEARLAVAELERPMVQARDRRDKAQAEAAARLRTAFLQPHEALEHPLAVGLGDARPVVGNAEDDAVPVARGGNGDVRLAVGTADARRT